MLLTSLTVCTTLAILSSTLAFADKHNPNVESGQTPVSNQALETSAKASQNWLTLLDQGKYGESWDQASPIMKLTIKREQWITILDSTRKPRGAVKSREVIDQRTAKDPKGLPPGEYMVMLYKTSFATNPDGKELVTLFFNEGVWNVLTYQVE